MTHTKAHVIRKWHLAERVFESLKVLGEPIPGVARFYRADDYKL